MDREDDQQLEGMKELDGLRYGEVKRSNIQDRRFKTCFTNMLIDGRKCG